MKEAFEKIVRLITAESEVDTAIAGAELEVAATLLRFPIRSI